MPIKDQAKRREYQKELMRKRRQGLTENVSPVVSPVSPRLDPNLNVSPQMLDPGLTVRPIAELLDPVLVRPKLWSDYYSAKKPYCHSCQLKGIPENQYAFCSENQIALDEFKCLVKHWTIYQGNHKKGENM